MASNTLPTPGARRASGLPGRPITRRTLLVAVPAATFIILRDGASARSYAANEKLNLAHVGCGGRGKELLGAFTPLANPVALCDVNEGKARESFARFPDVPKFKDFRVMLEEMGGRVDGVVVATPDHTHAVATAAAMRAGKHVYTEKPLTRAVRESRALRALARERKVATSMGNQGTASGPFRRALELIRGGTIGAVKEVHVWNDSGGAGATEPPRPEAPLPETLAWDLWLGPAHDRPFRSSWLRWQQWRDFGTGNLGNWASHTANLAFMALKVDALWQGGAPPGGAIRVESTAQGRNHLSFPRWETVTWHVPTRAGLPPVSFHWYNGAGAPGARDRIEAMLGRPLDWGDRGAKKWADFAGCLIVGSEGKIHATGHNATFTLLPEEKFRDVARDAPQEVEASPGHEREWLSACRGGKPAWANFEYAVPLNEFLQLGNLATRFDGPLEFDPSACRVTNHAEADAALALDYRAGWSL